MIKINMDNEELYKNLKKSIDNLKIFDSHDHLMYETERRRKKIDFFTLFICTSYLGDDLMSSGMGLSNLEKLADTEVDLEKKWSIFSPYWKKVKNTCYSKVFKIAVKDIYKIDDINLNSIIKINKKIDEFNKTQYYQDILVKRCNISFVLNDLDSIEEDLLELKEPDKDFYLPVMRLDNILIIHSKDKILKIEEENNININSLSDYIDYIDDIFEKRKNTTYGLKIGTAYIREILFEEVTFFEAEKAFQKILKLGNYDLGKVSKDSISIKETGPFIDFMHHYIIKKAIEYNMPIQIHTGMLCGSDNDIRNSNPTHLINLILKYRKAKFDLFHTGYPYTDELITMIKSYPNCYFNMCWIIEVSELLYKRILDLAIEMIPSNKIIAFGGDNLFVEGTYASLKIAKEAIVDVLYKKVLEKYFSFKEAVQFGERILYKNSDEIYQKG